MIKFKQLMMHGVGKQTVSFTGREPFQVKDEKFKADLLAHGVFEELEDGSLRYSGAVTVLDKNGKTHQVDKDGYLDVEKSELPDEGADAFL